jgi:hypothetical protein
LMKFQPLDLIQKYYGTKIAFYFAWLGFYTRCLYPVSLLGIICVIYGLRTVGNVCIDDFLISFLYNKCNIFRIYHQMTFAMVEMALFHGNFSARPAKSIVITFHWIPLVFIPKYAYELKIIIYNNFLNATLGNICVRQLCDNSIYCGYVTVDDSFSRTLEAISCWIGLQMECARIWTRWNGGHKARIPIQTRENAHKSSDQTGGINIHISIPRCINWNL